MAEAVVSFALNSIGILLIQKAKLLYGIHGEVQDLQEELSMMRGFLKDADAKQGESETISNLVVRIREVAYAIEDTIETYAIKVSFRKRKRVLNILWKSAYFFDEVKDRCKIRSEIKHLKSEITKFSTSLQTYGVVALGEREGSNSTRQRRVPLRRTYSHVVEDGLVGFEEDVKTLVEEVVSTEKHRSRVVSICGMGGLGKTTLARKIYYHQEVRRCFDAFAWACISQQWQLKDVLQRILVKLIPEKRTQLGHMIESEMVKLLYEFQKQKRCLVVLDDIWLVDDWDALSPAFPSVNNSSKILLTTRKKNVATHVDESCFLHEPHCLSNEQSWKLFLQKAFPTTYDTDLRVDAELEKLGKQMVEQCGGLPLAIVVLGGILATKHTLGQWEEVHRNVNSYLMKGKGHGGQYSRVMEVLALSYQDLPYQLKACFLYLGSYPEHFDIEVEKLYQLWMAEGIITVALKDSVIGEEETMMDVAENYLGELARRCMVQVESDLEEYKIIRGRGSERGNHCRVHDLFRELCLSKLKEENFLTVIDHRRKGSGHSSSSCVAMSSTSSGNTGYCRTHRLAIYLDKHTSGYLPLFKQEEGIQDIRSILFFACPDFTLLDGQLGHCGNKFRMLRVLDLSWFTFGSLTELKGLPKEIGNLVLLRYLALRNARLTELPSSIGNLIFLQTLDLRITTHVKVPNVLLNMTELMHLYLPEDYDGTLQIDGLGNLETLENFKVSQCNINGLLNLRKLRVLKRVCISENLEDLAALTSYLNNSYSKWLQFTSIEIFCCEFCSEKGINLLRQVIRSNHLSGLFITGIINKLPEYDTFSYQSLTSLSLVSSELKEDPMKTLEKLPKLRSLTLGFNVFVGKQMVCSPHGFPQLKHLVLMELQLEEWKVEDEAMPNLSYLCICKCPKLKMLPHGLTFISKLQMLNIVRMPESFKARLQVLDGMEGEDVCKLSHIPAINFLDL